MRVLTLLLLYFCVEQHLLAVFPHTGQGEETKHQRDQSGQKRQKNVCREGRRQSPIDLDLGGNLSKRYFLRQLHFHWNSEHTINGLHYPLEAHLVHAGEDFNPKTDDIAGSVVIVAVLFRLAEEDLSGIDAVLSATYDFKPRVPISSFNPAVVLPNDLSSFFTYSVLGKQKAVTFQLSLLTAPKRSLVSTIIQLATQAGREEDNTPLWERNSRPVQHSNGRKLLLNKSGKAVKEDEIIQEVVIIVLVFVSLMLVPPFLIMWVIQKKASLADPDQTSSSQGSTNRSSTTTAHRASARV
ncbi:unnamed protein product [Heligmosomoides polygyrus]|uniref:Carbonic anhydrase n=1 Tax=Heligmosomoides polygyrus TaxID=6339 RepID=A0A3P7YCZ4_HELPZ|nr:unnamed protein product [Heligmosomoides polygyrus]